MEQILGQILAELQGLRDGQARIETIVTKQGEEIAGLRADVNQLKQDVNELKLDVNQLKQDVGEIKTELRFVWEDIKKLDKRLSAHDEELVILKRLK